MARCFFPPEIVDPRIMIMTSSLDPDRNAWLLGYHFANIIGGLLDGGLNTPTQWVGRCVRPAP
jgi:hypothetical protein